MGVTLGVLVAVRTAYLPRNLSNSSLPLRDSGLTLYLSLSNTQQLLRNPSLHNTWLKLATGCSISASPSSFSIYTGVTTTTTTTTQAQKTDLQPADLYTSVSNYSAIVLRGSFSRLPPIRDGSRRDGKRKRNHPDHVPLTLKRMG